MKNKVKKAFAVILAATTLMTMAACKDKQGDDSASSSQQGGVYVATMTDLEPADDEGDSQESPETPGSGSKQKEAEEQPFESCSFSNNYLTFRVESLEAGKPDGYTLQVYLENLTDTALQVSWENVSVNGYVCNPFWSVALEAGETVTKEVRFSGNQLYLNGIEKIFCVDFDLVACESESNSLDYLVHERMSFARADYEPTENNLRLIQDTDVILRDNNDCIVCVTGIDGFDELGRYSLLLYLENKSGKDIIFFADSSSVNGQSNQHEWEAVVPAGKAYNTTISWDWVWLSEISVPDMNGVTEIRLPISAYAYSWDNPAYRTKTVINETFTYTPAR